MRKYSSVALLAEKWLHNSIDVSRSFTAHQVYIYGGTSRRPQQLYGGHTWVVKDWVDLARRAAEEYSEVTCVSFMTFHYTERGGKAKADTVMTYEIQWDQLNRPILKLVLDYPESGVRKNG